MNGKTPVRLVRPLAPRRPLASPAAFNPFDMSTVMGMFTTLTDMHTKVSGFMDKLEKSHASVVELAGNLEKKYTNFDAIKQGPPGRPGEDGLPGPAADHEAVVNDVAKKIRQPADGKSPDVQAVASAIMPLVVKHLKKNAPTKVKELVTKEVAAPVDMGALKDQLFEEIKSGKRKLTVADIEGLDTRFAEVRNAAAMGTPEIYGKNTWKRGGGDTVVAGNGVTITNTINGNKEIAVSGGAGYQQPTSGAVDGTNATFMWTTAPHVIVVDQGRPMQKVSSDGTVNWTGTTTTVLAVAPNFDIFATA